MSAPGAAAFDAIGQKLVAKYGTRDPEELCARMGICLYEEDFGRLKGMYRIILRRRCVFVNRSLDADMRRMVLAHEIGHDRLHREFAKGAGLGELELFDMSARREYEANMVAAGILLDDKEVLEGIYYSGYDASALARQLRVDINLIALKADALRDKGYPLHATEHDSRFLRS